MYDQYSNDISRPIARELGIEVRSFGRMGQLNDQWYLDVKNHCWKECKNSGVDYVIVCDADEFLIPDNLSGTAPIVHGFNMVSDHLPVNEITEINTGHESENYSKQIIFSPDHVEEINYVHGCHRNHIKGNIQRGGSSRLLHYRQIGGIERMLTRHHEYQARMSKFNLQHKMGFHYMHSDDQKRIEFEELKKQSRILW